MKFEKSHLVNDLFSVGIKICTKVWCNDIKVQLNP